MGIENRSTSFQLSPASVVPENEALFGGTLRQRRWLHTMYHPLKLTRHLMFSDLGVGIRLVTLTPTTTSHFIGADGLNNYSLLQPLPPPSPPHVPATATASVWLLSPRLQIPTPHTSSSVRGVVRHAYHHSRLVLHLMFVHHLFDMIVPSPAMTATFSHFAVAHAHVSSIEQSLPVCQSNGHPEMTDRRRCLEMTDRRRHVRR